MSKKIVGDDGKTYVQKKPFYKRIWFIILVIIVLFVVFASMNGGGDDSAKKVDSESSSKSSKAASSTQKTFNVGDTAEYQGIRFKVNSVNYTDGDPDVDQPDSGKRYVVANITITNNSDDKVDYNPYDYKLDDNGNQTDFDETVSNVNDELNDGTLSKGGSVTGNLVGQANTNDTLKLIYSGNMFSNKEHVVFNLK